MAFFPSMQSIQNLGLAVISILAGMILDTRGYLFLEVFFIACVSGKVTAPSVISSLGGKCSDLPQGFPDLTRTAKSLSYSWPASRLWAHG